ncbi:PMD domain-containing protein [Abeliophyllum distichum]|uniref:PMD domain-containing protein n=1 Tax=Abeliophyllum distichum TaxID=126358 RepID=A0ABD1QGM5_9LAMI
MATSKNPLDNRISFEDFQELMTRPYVNPSCLLPSKPELNEFYLGPSFNDTDSIGRAAVAQLFPCTQELPFLDPFSLKPICDKSIRTWPKADTTLHLWHVRMMKHNTTKVIFDRARISDHLEIATRPSLYDPILFPIALSFWSFEYNTFIFPIGPMSITLRDVGTLVNLPPLGDTISTAILISSATPKSDKKYTDSYSGMQDLYNNSGGEPTYAERVAFLQVWLCKYILCVPSLKPFMAYFSIAHELAHGRCPVPSYSPPKSLPIRTRSSAAASLQSSSPSTQTEVIRGASSQGFYSSFERLLGLFLQALLHLYHQTRKFYLKRNLKAQNLQPPSHLESLHLLRALFLQVWNQKDADAILRSIQDLFTSWVQVKASHAVRSSSASRPFTASAAFSIKNMNILKQAVLEYTSFMDMDIVNASAISQRDKFERLSNQMAQALELPSLKLPTDLKLSLKIIHREISALLAKNVDLKAKKT